MLSRRTADRRGKHGSGAQMYLRAAFPLIAAVTLLGASACGSGSHPSSTTTSTTSTQPQPTKQTSVITRTAVGGFATTGGFAAAQKLFGAPSSETQNTTVCVARWPDGLTIAWQRRLPATKWTKACVKFSWAKVAGKSWHTDMGLQVGAAETAIASAYPKATGAKAGATRHWTLTPGLNPSLQAWTKSGKIVSLRIVRS